MKEEIAKDEEETAEPRGEETNHHPHPTPESGPGVPVPRVQ